MVAGVLPISWGIPGPENLVNINPIVIFLTFMATQNSVC